ncbi:MAG: hypothetical protein BAJALOKI2v1_40065 [Promethearchaeota archaeon]|nr:MAG: hypothetical protein BAJALOKI2v1_40065 [Candidatus Lokiarchaeota archaeon]
MKNITVSLQIAIVSTSKELFDPFLKYLENLSHKNTNHSAYHDKKSYYEYFIIFENIPIKIKLHLAEDFNYLINNYEKTKNIDILIILTAEREDNKLKLSRNHLNQINELFLSSPSFIQVYIEREKNSSDEMIEKQLIEKAKNLGILYLFKIQPYQNEINEIFSNIFKDFILKFKFLSPELFEKAKACGIQLCQEEEKQKAFL